MVFHQNRPAPRARGLLETPLEPSKIWRTTLSIWIYCKPLKSHKTAKAFFGNVWRRQAEIWKSLQKAWRRRDRAGRTRRLQAMTAPSDSIISPCRLSTLPHSDEPLDRNKLARPQFVAA